MRNFRVSASLFLVGLAFAPAPTRAQATPAEAPPRVNEAAPARPMPVECAPKAGLYHAEKAPKIWLLRQGTMVLAENPLRPGSRDEAVVLEVVVNGRRVTAWGLDMNHLRQAGTPKSVEREGREPIRWAEASVAPPALRVIAEDGRVLIGPLAFVGCEDAPAAKAVADKPEPKPARTAKPERPTRGGQKKATSATDQPAPAHLPQGALQGLSLPKGGQR